MSSILPFGEGDCLGACGWTASRVRNTGAASALAPQRRGIERNRTNASLTSEFEFIRIDTDGGGTMIAGKLVAKLLVSLVAIWPSALSAAFVPSVAQELDETLRRIQARSPLPGFCVAIVDSSGMRYSNGFGVADQSSHRAYSADTVQPVASVSKTFIGVALMQAVEDGLISLDTAINDVTPFKIVNPRFPNDAIRLRQLATHTSGIVDRQPFYARSYVPGAQTRLDLQDFLSAYFATKGKYDRPHNFNSSAPGTRFEYSNIGAALAAYAVELRRKQSYAAVTRDRILKPLHMDSSGWSAGETGAVPATLYDAHGVKIAPYSLPTYADGGLFTSCNDLGKFLSEMIRGYAGNSRLLGPDSFHAMFAAQFCDDRLPTNVDPEAPNEGIFWEFSRRGEIGHSGGDPGVDSHMFFDPGSGVGRILITNTNSADDRPAIEKTLDAIWMTLGTFENRLTSREANAVSGAPSRVRRKAGSMR